MKTTPLLEQLRAKLAEARALVAKTRAAYYRMERNRTSRTRETTVIRATSNYRNAQDAANKISLEVTAEETAIACERADTDTRMVRAHARVYDTQAEDFVSFLRDTMVVATKKHGVYHFTHGGVYYICSYLALLVPGEFATMDEATARYGAALRSRTESHPDGKAADGRTFLHRTESLYLISPRSSVIGFEQIATFAHGKQTGVLAA